MCRGRTAPILLRVPASVQLKARKSAIVANQMIALLEQAWHFGLTPIPAQKPSSNVDRRTFELPS